MTESFVIAAGYIIPVSILDNLLEAIAISVSILTGLSKPSI
jgi:hypothetical protein